MHALPVQFARHHFFRQLVIWALACALPINSISTVLSHLLGSQHRHSISVLAADMTPGLNVHSLIQALVGDDAMDMIDAYHAHEQSLRPPEPAAVHGMTAQEHAHAHSLFQRHHHDPTDGTVVAIGEKDPGQDVPGGASSVDASGAFPLPSTWMSARLVPSATAQVWPGQAITAWHNHVSAPLERPPRG
jgi:hypothetical protein